MNQLYYTIGTNYIIRSKNQLLFETQFIFHKIHHIIYQFKQNWINIMMSKNIFENISK